jgi:hypothetical protein
LNEKEGMTRESERQCETKEMSWRRYEIKRGVTLFFQCGGVVGAAALVF